MMDFEQGALALVRDAYRRGACLALLFDYDGTLVPIAEHPRLAVLTAETRRRLDRLARTPSAFVGVLSGRSIENLETHGRETAELILWIIHGDVQNIAAA